MKKRAIKKTAGKQISKLVDPALADLQAQIYDLAKQLTKLDERVIRLEEIGLARPRATVPLPASGG